MLCGFIHSSLWRLVQLQHRHFILCVTANNTVERTSHHVLTASMWIHSHIRCVLWLK